MYVLKKLKPYLLSLTQLEVIIIQPYYNLKQMLINEVSFYFFRRVTVLYARQLHH